MSNADIIQPELPYGYVYVPQAEIDARDVLKVRETPPEQWDAEISKWIRVIGLSTEVVGVGTTDGPDRVVGVGFISGNGRHGILCDLTVHSAYRHIGIGRALIQERIRRADEQDYDYLLTDLAEDNPLEGFYRQLGFEGIGKTLRRIRAQ